MTFVPPGVQKAQASAQSFSRRTAVAWPKNLVSYPSEALGAVLEALAETVQLIDDAIARASRDPAIRSSAELSALGTSAIVEVNHYGGAFLKARQLTATAPRVKAPLIRQSVLATMPRLLAIWKSLAPFHDASFSWLTDEQAAEIAAGYEKIFEAATKLPGATRPLSQRSTIAWGASLLGILGTGVWMALRGTESGMMLPQAHEEEPLPIPVGIHSASRQPQEPRTKIISDGDSVVIHGAKSPDEIFAAVRNLSDLRREPTE